MAIFEPSSPDIIATFEKKFGRTFWTSDLGRKCPMKVESVRPSLRLSVSFLGIGSLVFSET